MDRSLPSARRGCVALLALVALLLALPGRAVAADERIGTVNVSTRLTHSSGSIRVAPGDQIRVEARLRPGPLPPGPTEMKVWSGNPSFQLLLSGEHYDSRTFVVTSDTLTVFGKGERNWDADDRGEVAVYRLPRPDLTIVGPSLEADGRVHWGYRVGNRPWFRYDANRPVVLQLFYATDGRPLGDAIDTRTLSRTAAGSSNSFDRALVDLPRPPSAARQILAFVDATGVITESDEGDNRGTVALPPSAAPRAPSYDPSGDIVLELDVRRPAPRGSLLTLWYARGPRREDILRDGGPVSSWNFPLHGAFVQRAEVEFPGYRLPPPEATHLVVLFDEKDDVREAFPGEESDNVASAPVRVAPLRPDYQAKKRSRGVGVYEREDGSGRWMATVVDLTQGYLRHDFEVGRIQPSDSTWWGRLEALTTPRSGRLVAAVNGAFFDCEQFGLGCSQALQLAFTNSFPYGLKRDGLVVSEVDPVIVERAEKREPAFLVFDTETAGIIRHERGWRFLRGLPADPRYPDVVGGIDGLRRETRARTWTTVGLRDRVAAGARGEDRFRTAVFLTTTHLVSPGAMVGELAAFGVEADDWLQLDGGASTRTILDARTSVRPGDLVVRYWVPHMIGAYSR